LKSKKGQALVCRYPEHLPPLAFSVVGEGHISMTEDPSICYLGSTYEEDFDARQAYLLKEKIAAFFPPAREFEVLHVLSGERIAPKSGYLPLVQQVAPRCFVFAGLGSRGLLYHALYAKAVAKLLTVP
jgi:glycine/D-amino acid oxidase-like deaminating enzyme